jgi:hypothetical protein
MLMHYNAGLKHQCQHARAFIQGCPDLLLTDQRHGDADCHIISGNWFAYSQWRHHPRVLMIDRAWWGDGDEDPKVSIGWLQPDGSRKFATGSSPRSKPELFDWRVKKLNRFGELSALVLADYGQDVCEIVSAASKRFVETKVRVHPSDCPTRRPATLEMECGWRDVVIGTSGSSIFEAIIMGIPVICLDPLNECAPVCSDSIGAELYRGDREAWLHRLSYAQFSLSEIADGTAWNLLKDVQ